MRMMMSEFDQPGRKPVKERDNKVVVAVEAYKVKRFRSVLESNGYETELGKGLTPDMRFLYLDGVDKAELPKLKKILERLQHEFAHRN